MLSGQSFDEAKLVASMYELLLEDAGYTVETKLVTSRDQYLGELSRGRVDVVPEYVGGILNLLNSNANGADADPITTADAEASIEDARPLLEEAGITLLEVSEASDTNAFFVTREYAEANDVDELSDLEGESVVLAAAPDCEGRPDCEGGLSGVYGIDVTKVLPLGFGGAATYESVKSGESQLGLTATTDGSLEAQGLVLLEDDREIQPAQNLVPAVNSDFLAENEELPDLLDPLMDALTTEALAELNNRVTVEREEAEAVARDYLEQEGLL